MKLSLSLTKLSIPLSHCIFMTTLFIICHSDQTIFITQSHSSLFPTCFASSLGPVSYIIQNSSSKLFLPSRRPSFEHAGLTCYILLSPSITFRCFTLAELKTYLFKKSYPTPQSASVRQTNLKALNRLQYFFAHRFICFSSISVRFSYSSRAGDEVRQFSFNFWRKLIYWLTDWLIVMATLLWLPGSHMPPPLGGDFSPWLRGTGSNMSLKMPNVTVIYPATSLMSLALSMILKLTFAVPFCLIHTMLSTN